MTARRCYVPEIHDVHPGAWDTVQLILDMLPPHARTVAVLLVVPKWRGVEPITRAPVFLEALRALEGEKVLHGLTHVRGADWWNRWTYGTVNHAEFAKLGPAVADRLLDEATAIFEEAFDRPPQWFCAPRFRQSRHVAEAVRAHGLGLLTHSGLITPQGREVHLPALWFDEGTLWWRNMAARMLRLPRQRWLFQTEQPFRLALHPADCMQPGRWRDVRDVLDTLAASGWTPVSLDALATGRHN